MDDANWSEQAAKSATCGQADLGGGQARIRKPDPSMMLNVLHVDRGGQPNDSDRLGKVDAGQTLARLRFAHARGLFEEFARDHHAVDDRLRFPGLSGGTYPADNLVLWSQSHCDIL
jgi:hypothetical protein